MFCINIKERKRDIWGYILTRNDYRNVMKNTSCVHFTLKRHTDIYPNNVLPGTFCKYFLWPVSNIHNLSNYLIFVLENAQLSYLANKFGRVKCWIEIEIILELYCKYEDY